MLRVEILNPMAKKKTTRKKKRRTPRGNDRPSKRQLAKLTENVAVARKIEKEEIEAEEKAARMEKGKRFQSTENKTLLARGLKHRPCSLTQLRFLAAYRQSGRISVALVESNTLRKNFERWRDNEVRFQEQFLVADQDSKDEILVKCREIAMDGNVTMLIHLSKGFFPEFWGTTKHEYGGIIGQPIQIEQKMDTTVDQLLNKIHDVYLKRQQDADAQTDTGPRMVRSKDGILCTQNGSTESGTEGGSTASVTRRRIPTTETP